MNYSQRANMMMISGISGTTQYENITSRPNNYKYSITHMNRSTRQVSRVYQLSNYEGAEWIMEMVMEMVLVMMMGMM